jgi:hypothetical protein
MATLKNHHVIRTGSPGTLPGPFGCPGKPWEVTPPKMNHYWKIKQLLHNLEGAMTPEGGGAYNTEHKGRNMPPRWVPTSLDDACADWRLESSSPEWCLARFCKRKRSQQNKNLDRVCVSCFLVPLTPRVPGAGTDNYLPSKLDSLVPLPAQIRG